MTMWRTRSLAWSLWGASVLLTCGGLLFLVLDGDAPNANSVGPPALDAVAGLLLLTFATAPTRVSLWLRGTP